jgi:hypothetical protein
VKKSLLYVIKRHVVDPEQVCHDQTTFRHRLNRGRFPSPIKNTQDRHEWLTKETELLLRAQQRTKRLDFALELSTANLHIVTFGFDFLELCFESGHLVDAFLSIPASCKSVGFALLDARRRLSRRTAFRGWQFRVW